jgi:hypothetical protein
MNDQLLSYRSTLLELTRASYPVVSLFDFALHDLLLEIVD